MHRTGVGPARRTLWYVAWALLGAVQGGVPQCSTSLVACLSKGNVTFDSVCDRSTWQQLDRCMLGCPLSLRIHSPDSLQGMWLCGVPDGFVPYYPEASMDEAHPLNNVELRLTAPALSPTGCALSDYEPSHNHSGTIVIVRRGGCQFSQKVEVMSSLGAAAGVVVDSQLTPSLLSQGATMIGTRATARIPTMMVPQHTGAVLLHALASGTTVHAAVRFRCGGDTDSALVLPPPHRYACPNARLVGLCGSASVAANRLCTSCPLLYGSDAGDAVCLWGSDLYPHAAANHLAGQPGSLYPTLPARLRETLVLVSADVDLCSRQTHAALARDAGPSGRILVASVPTAGCLAYHVAWHASQAGLRAVWFVASPHDGGVPSIEGSSRVVEIPVHALSLNDSAVLRELFAAKGSNATLLGGVPVVLLGDGGGASLWEPPVVPEGSDTPSPGVGDGGGGGGGGSAYVPVVHDDSAEEAMTERVLITCSVLIGVMCVFLLFILRRGLKADVRLRGKIEELGVPNNQMSAAAASDGAAPRCRVHIPLRLAMLGFVGFLLVWMVVATYMAAMQAGTKALDTSRHDGEAAAMELHESARARVVNLTMVVTSESLRSAAVFVTGQMGAAEMLATLLTGLYIDLDGTWASFDAQYDRFITLLRGFSPSSSGIQTSVITTNGFFAGRTLYTDWEHQTASGAFVNETNNGFLHPIAGQLYSTLAQRNVAASRQFPVGTGPLYQLGSAPGDPHALTAGRPRGFKAWLLSVESFPLPSTGSDSGLPKQPVTVSSPIFNRNGAFVGTVSVWMEIAALQDVLLALTAQAGHFDPTYALIDVRAGKVLSTNVGPSVTVPLRQWSKNGMFLALDCVPLHRIANVPLIAAHGYLTQRGTQGLEAALKPPLPPSDASTQAEGAAARKQGLSTGTGDGDGDGASLTWTTLSTNENSPIVSMWSAGYDAADFFTDPGYVLMHLRLRPAADAASPPQLEDASGNLWDSEVRGAPGGTPEAASFERFEDRDVVSLSGSAEHAWFIYRNLTTDLPRVQAAAASGNPLFAPSSSVGRGRRCVSANGKCAWREDVVGVGIESRTVILRVHPLAAYGGPTAGNDPTLFADVEAGIPFLRVQAAGRMLVGDRRFVCETATPPAGVLPPYEWSVVAAVYEVDKQCSFYVNGVLVSRVGARSVDGEVLTAQGPLVVGRGFHGRISDVVVLNRTLSDMEVAKVGRGGSPEDLHPRQAVSSELWVASGGRIARKIDGGTCLEIVSLVKRATILRVIEEERDAAFRRFDDSNERTEDELAWQGKRLRLILATLVLGALCIYSVFNDVMLRHLQCIASVLIDASVMRLYGYTMMSSPLHELDAMHRALTALMLNLQQYRPYLPDALFGGTGCLLQNPDKELLDPGARTGAVAVLFTDVRNSTELWEAMPNTMPAALRVHNEVVRTCLKRTEGYEVKTIGDSFMIAFASPTEACRFALRLQIELYRAPWPAALCQHHLCRTDESRQQNGLMIRIGINYGHVDIDSNPITKRSDYFGPVVNKASRIEGCGITGAVTISEDVLSELLIEADSRPASSIWDPEATDDAASRGGGGGGGCGRGCAGSTGELSVHTYSSEGTASNPLTAREVLSRSGGVEPSDLQSLSTPYVTPMHNIELRGVDGPNLLFVLLPRALHLRTHTVRQEIEHFSEVRAYKQQTCVDDAATCSSDGSGGGGGGGGLGARRGSNSSSLGSRSSASASAPSDCFDLQKQTQTTRMRRKGNAAVARTDITLLAFSADPQEALRLHEPLSRIFTSIERTDGSIISVVGSSIFSAWNTLKPCASPTDQSLRYCRVLRGSRSDYRSAYAVGLASGPVLYGPFGTQLQKFITTFGPCVALASSLCLAAQHLDTLALVLPTSFVATVENLKEMAQGQRTLLARRPLEKMAVRGRQLMVFELKADADDANATAHFMSPFDADGSVGSGKRRSEVPKPPPWGWGEEYLHAFLDGDHQTIRRMASQNDLILERVADAMQGKFSLVQYPRFSEKTRDVI